MAAKGFKYAAFAIKILEKLIGANFSVTGVKNIPKDPVMFVANHFTRMETFIVPYLIFKYNNRQVKSLADSSLFSGFLGKILDSVGAISTKDEKRDEIILRDLILSQSDWLIYPEGSMLKNKKIEKKSRFTNYTPGRVGPVRTGSAVLALKSQIYRNNLVSALKKGDNDKLSSLEKKLSLKADLNLDKVTTKIVPVNISYYPIRPGDNNIKKIISKFVKKIPKSVAEELEIEGNILLNSHINVDFGEVIDVKEFIKNKAALINAIPIISYETKADLLIKYFRIPLTLNFMTQVYGNCHINFDHLFAAALKYSSKDEITISLLKKNIYLSGILIAKIGKYKIHESILESNLVKILNDEPCEIFDGVFDLAVKQKLITKKAKGKIKINKKAFEKNYDFHEIRRENSLQVVFNEFSLLRVANDIVRKNAKLSEADISAKLVQEIFNYDLLNYDLDHESSYDRNFSKNKNIGRPFYLKSNNKNSSKVGILIVHGYKSSPAEVKNLANYLHKEDFDIYAVRLKGHGTTPMDLRDSKWSEWYDSLNRGYSALNAYCDKIIIIGFSTGGLLTLLSSSLKNKENNLAAIISINAALKLRDIRVKFISGIHAWNEWLNKFSIKKGQLEYVEDEPENKETNYYRNYIKSVKELGHLMEICDDNLSKIKANSLIIQAKDDPIVNPVSGKKIYKKIAAKNKVLKEVDFDNHVIINGKNQDKIFKIIKDYLKSYN